MSETTSTDVDIFDTSENLTGKDIASLADSKSTIFSTMGQLMNSKIEALHAITAAEPIRDHIGERIMLTNVVAQMVNLADDDGVVTEAIRLVLVDEDGTAYAGISGGLFSSVKALLGVLGEPSTWPRALPVRVVEKRTRKGYKCYSLEVERPE